MALRNICSKNNHLGELEMFGECNCIAILHLVKMSIQTILHMEERKSIGLAFCFLPLILLCRGI